MNRDTNALMPGLCRRRSTLRRPLHKCKSTVGSVGWPSRHSNRLVQSVLGSLSAMAMGPGQEMAGRACTQGSCGVKR